jgi:hypothetical protein
MPASRLMQLASSAPAPRPAAEPDERCDLCAAPIPAEHRHLLRLADRELMCACTPCSLLFYDDVATNGRYRLVPDRRLRLDGFVLDDVMWEELRLPVDMAFFFRDTAAERVSAFYPSPMGPTESLLPLEAWQDLEAANPVLATLAPDVEALLVNRARGARQHFLVGVDECYALVAVIRTRWRGFTGGKEVWEAIRAFYADLDRRATAAPAAAGRQ